MVTGLQICPDGDEVLEAFGVFHAIRQISGGRHHWAIINASCQLGTLEFSVLREAASCTAPGKAVLWKC